MSTRPTTFAGKLAAADVKVSAAVGAVGLRRMLRSPNWPSSLPKHPNQPSLQSQFACPHSDAAHMGSNGDAGGGGSAMVAVDVADSAEGVVNAAVNCAHADAVAAAGFAVAAADLIDD